MKTRKLHIDDLSEQRALNPDELKSIQGGNAIPGLLSSPLGSKYLPEPESVWVREVTEDAYAY
jgi:hypothetical protein